MRIIGVLDLAGGFAVHACAGPRERYGKVSASAGISFAAGDARALALGYLDRLGIRELYAADLDAIAGKTVQCELLRSLAQLNAPLWLDAGVASAVSAREVLNLGAQHVVVGLETLPSWAVLREICNEVGGERVTFSLDLHDNHPIITAGRNDPALSLGEPAHLLAVRAADAGVGSMIVLDLVRVGTSSGPDLEQIARVREVVPDLTLMAGGGVRGPDDLRQLHAAGCHGALVATALHDGRLSPDDIEILSAAVV